MHLFLFAFPSDFKAEREWLIILTFSRVNCWLSCSNLFILLSIRSNFSKISDFPIQLQSGILRQRTSIKAMHFILRWSYEQDCLKVMLYHRSNKLTGKSRKNPVLLRRKQYDPKNCYTHWAYVSSVLRYGAAWFPKR